MIEQRNDCWSSEMHHRMVASTSHNLWRYIQRNAQMSLPKDELFLKLAQLTPDNVKTLLNIHFLLSEETVRFITEVAPAILNRLSKSSVNDIQIQRGASRGRIHWGRTYAARATRGGDSTLFVSSTRSSVFDLPENQVFLFMLHQTATMMHQVINTRNDHDAFDQKEVLKQKWGDKLSMMASCCAKLLKHPVVPQIERVQMLTERQIEQTEQARGQWYSELVKLARSYLQSVEYPIEFLYERMQFQFLEPLNRDILFELAVLFRVIDTADACGWREQCVGLIGSDSEVVSVLEKQGITLSVYYQGTPYCFKEESLYKPLMKKYGLSNRTRRPDIILEWSNGEQYRYCIIEVKRSSRREYLVDGVYKLFGYLKDFENALKGTVLPQAVLVGWGGIKEVLPVIGEGVYVTSWDLLSNTLTVILENPFCHEDKQAIEDSR